MDVISQLHTTDAPSDPPPRKRPACTNYTGGWVSFTVVSMVITRKIPNVSSRIRTPAVKPVQNELSRIITESSTVSLRGLKRLNQGLSVFALSQVFKRLAHVK
jgi:hypothetical protein